MDTHSKTIKLRIYKNSGLPLTHRDRILQEVKSGSSHITYHTSHITYCVWICKFYKIKESYNKCSLKTHKNLSRISMLIFVVDGNHCIDNTNAYVKWKISQTILFILKSNTFQNNLISYGKCLKSKTLVFFFKSDLQIVSNQNSVTYTLSVFLMQSMYMSQIFHILQYCNRFWRKKKQGKIMIMGIFNNS